MTNLFHFIAPIVLVALCVIPSIVKADDCTISDYSQVASVTATCTNIIVGSFTVPSTTILIFKLKQGSTLTFTGTVSFTPAKVDGYLMEIMGNDVIVQGNEDHLLHGNGQTVWDGKGLNGGAKPTFLYLKGNNSLFANLTLKNCPARCVAIDGSHNSIFSGFDINNSEGAVGVAPAGLEGHNTDGFDVDKSYYITIKDSNVTNQDDCVAINQASHVLVDNFQCTGSHGFDIATGMFQDASKNIVENITFSNSVLSNGMYGLHILTCSDGGLGRVDQITYNNIRIQGPSDYGIMIQQDFSNAKQGSTGIPVGNVPVTNVKYNNVQGFMNGKFSSSIVFRCASGACNNITGSNVEIQQAKSKNECSVAPIGFLC